MLCKTFARLLKRSMLSFYVLLLSHACCAKTRMHAILTYSQGTDLATLACQMPELAHEVAIDDGAARLDLSGTHQML